MTIRSASDNLHLIPLDLPKEGFHHFLCAWLYREDNRVLLIDPGPRATMPALLQALDGMGIRHIDQVLLTHIHLDHAGGLGLLLQRYPEARAICHPRGIPHLLKPDRLWETSLKVLFETAVLYGEPAPVERETLLGPSGPATFGPAVEAYDTPGHAPHHLCFKIGDLLFTGEAAGIFYPLEGGPYLRIAAPPGFDLHHYRKSLARLRAVDASVICYAHWGRSQDIRTLLGMAAAQTELWAAVIEAHAALPDPLFEQRVFESLLARDPGLSRFHDLPADVQMREKYFLGNSFRGIRMSLKKRQDP